MNTATNEALIGQDGSRLDLSTPALVIDMPTFKSNLRSGQDIIANNGVGLRPHIKAHRCLEIAKLQMKLGAKGISCATLEEAEALAAGEITKLLITKPVTEPAEIERLGQLNNKLEDLMVVVESIDQLEGLKTAARAVSKKFRLLIEVDIEGKGSGVSTIEEGLALTKAIAEAPELRFFGLQGYSHAVQHIAKTTERRKASHAQIKLLKDLKKAIKDQKIPVRVTSGSATGTHLIDMEAATYNDIQLGSYCFMDAAYQAIHLKLWGKIPYHPALFIYTRVIEGGDAGTVKLDAGSKSLPADAGAPTVHSGAPSDSRYEALDEDSGQLVLPEGAEAPEVGSLVALTAPSCAATVALYDQFHCVRDDKLAAIWQISVTGSKA